MYFINSIKLSSTIFFFVFILSIPAKSQNKLIMGSWKVVEAFNVEMRYNFTKDSLSFSSHVMDGLDSLIVQKALSSFLRQMKKYVFQFDENGVYKEIHDNVVISQGSYLIDDKEAIIKTTVRRNNVIAKEAFQFSINGNELLMNPIPEGNGPNLILEKIHL